MFAEGRVSLDQAAIAVSALSHVRAERGEPFVHALDDLVWGEPPLRLTHPVSASSAVADVTFKPVRFVCRADVWAFEGTEAVAALSG